MKKIVCPPQKLSVYLALVFFVLSCAPLIGPYSHTAYQNATNLKPKTLALMDKATEPYADHRGEVEALAIELQQAYEFVKGIPSNSISAAQWEILIKEDGDLLGKFVTRWKASPTGTLKPVFIKEFKGPISDAFDEIICLEANKKEPTKCGQE